MIKDKFKKLVSIILTLLQIFVAYPCGAANLEAIGNKSAAISPSSAIAKTNHDLEKGLPNTTAAKDAESKTDETAMPEQNKETPKDEDPTIIVQGTCGTKVNWVLYSDGLLDISGTGAMSNYSYSSGVPWYSHKIYITSVNIGDGVTSIGNYAFYSCSNLTSVNIGNGVISIGERAFYDCSSLISVTIGNSVTSIGGSAFYGCSSLASINIPNSVTSIGEYAFYSCSSLASINIPNSVTSIKKYTFYTCSSLESINISNSVTSIGERVFENCSKLTSVTMGNSITSIGDWAFQGCSSLISIDIPNSVTSIGDSVFNKCSSLTSINVDPDNQNYQDIDGVLLNKAGTTLIHYPAGNARTSYEIPDGVFSIYYDAFLGCSKLKSINISDSVTRIWGSAFQNCSSLTSVTMGNSVTSISWSAFQNCSSLISINIPNSVTSIEDSVFKGCSALTSVTIGNSVASIESNTFYGCSNLTSINIPNSVTSIGNDAFYGCSSLTSINIPNSVASIGERAFQNCSSLTSINIPNYVTSIGERAFYGCSSLTSATIGNSVTSIGGYAFYNCSKLTSVTIGNSVTSIGGYAFRSCSSLTSINIPNSVTSIGNYAFYDCSSLTSVRFNGTNNLDPSNIKGIFNNCNSLSKISVFPNYNATKFCGKPAVKDLYNITYDLQGGTVDPEHPNPTVCDIELDAFTLNNPTKTGYKFMGWTGSNGTTPQTEVKIQTGASGSAADKNFVANWAEAYNITYNLNGGSLAQGESNPEQYTTEEEFTLKNPTKAGYTFTGWTGSNGTTPQITVTIPKGSTGNKNYTANWELATYNITYDLNGGTLASGTSNPATYNIESDAITLNNPTREGCTFKGWTGSNGTTPAITVTIPKGSFGEKTYTANWEAINYSITYDLKGGELASGKSNPATYNIESNAITLNNPTKSGYTFVGWTGSNGTTPQMTVTIPKGSTGNKNYTANWELATYNITYDLNGGTLASGTSNPATYNIESDAITLNNPTREGCTFKGWTGSNGTTPQITVTIPKGSFGEKTYTANWEAINYSITYDLKGGELASGKSNPATYNIESNAITLNNPTKSGYTFVGWTGSNGTTPQMTVTIPKGSTGEKNYTANWELATYNITYDLKGGELASGKSNPATYNIESDAITLNNPTREGCTFKGWTGSNGTTPAITVTIPKGSFGEKTYTANWEAINYSITYDLKGGELASGKSNPATYNIESNAITLNNPTKAGYTFTGWTGSNGTTPQITVTIPKGSTGEKSYTANWELATYNITYDLNGGTLASGTSNPATYNIESDAITLNNPTKEGSDFTGWTGTELSGKTKTVTIAKGSIGDRNYTANWKLPKNTTTGIVVGSVVGGLVFIAVLTAGIFLALGHCGIGPFHKN